MSGIRTIHSIFGLRGRSSIWLEHQTVDLDVAGSSPVAPAILSRLYLAFDWSSNTHYVCMPDTTFRSSSFLCQRSADFTNGDENSHASSTRNIEVGLGIRQVVETDWPL
jgi:hypothetical protein